MSVLFNRGFSMLALSSAMSGRLSLFDHSFDWLIVIINNEDLVAVQMICNFYTFLGLSAWNNSGILTASHTQTQRYALSIPATTIQPGYALDLCSSTTLQLVTNDLRGADL
jgi:hypothetical protein